MSAREFQLEVVTDAFKKAYGPDGVIVLDEYIRGYDEICIFFDCLGSVFGFITSDVRDKIGILQHYRGGENCEKYVDVKAMFDFEVENDLTAAKTTPLSGSRTLLRLHRALDFTMLFLKRLSESEECDKSSSIASSSYDATLAQHHPWLIRKAAFLAMYTLPCVSDMIKKASGGQSDLDQESAKKLLHEATEAIKPVFDKTEELYTKYDLHGLP